MGGFNIGKEYIGQSKRFGYWRDTHLRILGSSVYALQMRFILDWNYAANENLFKKEKYLGYEFTGEEGAAELQIISSGPDSRMQNIRDNYLRLISKAKKSIYIQTPYFIPDEAIMSSLLIAVYSGIEVNVMIPCKPDHPFVYWATYSYIGDLVKAGANCYTFENGFLHAKGMIIDEEVMCYGTANMDIRSFALNFEVNAVIYDKQEAIKMQAIFKEDLLKCKRITKDRYSRRSFIIRAKEQVSRLLSRLL
jgi:cardiolipin synthase